MAITELCTVLSNKKITNTHHDMIISAPNLAKSAKPGQFLHIRCGHSRLLRRPISICDATDDMLRIVFETRGEGTAWLAKRCVNDTLDVLGTLGCGTFPILNSDDPVLLVGGGIGVPPLYYAGKAQNRAHAVLGFRTADSIILRDDFYSLCETLLIATDDGSFGAHGTIQKPLELLLSKNKYAAILTCGPKPMLKTAAALADQFHIPCWVSMEERMACGIGACLGCACKTYKENGEEEFTHVCKNGPVYPAEAIVW